MLKVLIVDDEYWVRLGLRETIPWESYGFCIVDDAADVNVGYEKYLKLLPDIVITDIRMEKTNGLDLIGKIRALGKNTDIIILSGYKEFEYAQKAIEYNVNSYLLKPINNDDLIEVLLSIKKSRGESADASALSNSNDNSDLKVNVRSFSNNEINNIIQNIRKVDYESSIEIINSYFSQIKCEDNLNIDALQQNVAEFVILILHSIFESKEKADNLFGTSFKPIKEIQGLKSINEIRSWTIQFINKIYEDPNVF